MSYALEIKNYDELPERFQNEYDFSDNDLCSFLCVYERNEIVRVYCDSYEPEDVTFNRDLGELISEMIYAYEKGYEDGKEDAGLTRDNY